jgi:uracil-DNA glycosylase family 4
MNTKESTRELQELVTATREHFKYIQELGVESIDTVNVFPAIDNQLPSPAVIDPTARQTQTSLDSLVTRTALAIQARSIQQPRTQPLQHDSLFDDLAPAGPTLARSTESFEAIHADVGNCTRCPLHQGRTNIVHTEGNRRARLMFVGEAPGADEDIQARPFVGKAGQLLTRIIEAIGFRREEVAIGNINRCRPPGNRAPTTEEAATCRPFLLREIAVVQPEVIVVLGNTAIKNLLETREGVTKLRGKFQDYNGIKVMPTFHPAYLLRDPSKKRETWEDLKMVRDYLDQNIRG